MSIFTRESDDRARAGFDTLERRRRYFVTPQGVAYSTYLSMPASAWLHFDDHSKEKLIAATMWLRLTGRIQAHTEIHLRSCFSNNPPPDHMFED